MERNRSRGRATPQPDSVKDRALVRLRPPQTGGHFLGALLSFAQIPGGRAQGQLVGHPGWLQSTTHTQAASPASKPRSASTEPVTPHFLAQGKRAITSFSGKPEPAEGQYFKKFYLDPEVAT